MEKIFNLSFSELNTIILNFIKSIIEYNNFNKHFHTLQSKVILLEKEVEELEYIINFCQQNDNKTFDDNNESLLNNGIKLRECQYLSCKLNYLSFEKELNAKGNFNFTKADEIKDYFHMLLNKVRTNFKHITLKHRKNGHFSSINHLISQNSLSTSISNPYSMKEDAHQEEVLYTECSKVIKDRLRSGHNINEIEKVARDSATFVLKTNDKRK